MKKCLLFLYTLFVFSFIGHAQVELTDNFDGGFSFDWNEYSINGKKVIVQQNYLLLKSSNDDESVSTTTELPIDYSQDFIIDIKLLVPRLNDEHLFGVILDRDENLESVYMLLKENYSVNMIATSRDIKSYDEQIIKLKSGKDVTVDLQLKRENGRFILFVNGMKAYSLRRQMHSQVFGFYTNRELKVLSVTVSQSSIGEFEMQ